MKILLDSCVTGKAVPIVRAANHDVVWVGDWPRDPGDEQILRSAFDESRVVITIDKDFGELAIAQGIIHCGIIRLVGFRAADQGPAIARLLSTYESDLTTAVILTAEPWRVRIRHP